MAEKKEKRGPIGSGISKEQELINMSDIRGILDANLKIAPHKLPDYMVGNLWTIDGKVQAAEAIMARLDYRSKLFKGHTKPPKEEENDS